MKEKLTISILGRSGAGKGTQARLIAERLRPYGVRHIETGHVLRSLLEKENATTLRARDVMKKGGIFPSWFAAYVWLHEFIDKGAGESHLVFDGSPRVLWDAELINDVLAWHERNPMLCIFLDIPEEEAMRRLLLRARTDDTETAIRGRLKFFIDDVARVIEYYQKSNRLLTVDGTKTPEEVFAAVDSALKDRLGSLWPSQ
jgi:adenylate kinase